MAKIKFPLKMADDAQARTIEELREHFDLASVLRYYDNGKLVEWLADRYYDVEAEKIKALEPSSNEFKRNLCEIFAVPYSEVETDDVDLAKIAAKNERYERLKQFTVDDTVLAAVDMVAFTQEDLADLLDKDAKLIYLCGERFSIPCSKGGVTYIGVNNPIIEFDNEIIGSDIDLQVLEFNIDDYLSDNIFDYLKNIENVRKFHKSFANNPVLGVKLLRIAAEKGSIMAQAALGTCYKDGFGTEKSEKESNKWFRKATAELEGNQKEVIMQNNPKLYEFSDVLLYAIGGKDNLWGGIRLNRHSLTIGGGGRTVTDIEIDVFNRNIVKEDIFSRFGTWPRIQPKLETALDEPKSAGGMIFNFLRYKVQETFTDAPPDYFGKLIKIDTGWGTIKLSDIGLEDEESLEKEFQNQINEV